MSRIFTADARDTPPKWTLQLFNSALAFGVLALLFSFAFYQLNYHWNWASVYKYRQKFLGGWWNTILISLTALVCSTAIGTCFALAQRARFLPLRYFSKLYVELIRGTPLLVQILIFFYVVADAFRVSNRYVVGVLTLSFFSGAYITEIIRAGIESIGQSQLESARAIGFTTRQTYRYVVFPQALRNILPPLAGQFVSLIKDSSLLSIIAIQEFTLNAREVSSYTFSALESYLPLAAGYLLLTLPISIWTRALEKKHRFET
ncbi:MAG TPA: amino acid ABC transporter permease [Candidatus Saccharimonadales bacterium]|nr:amino acid ABC transporter permease [Candidatus Saccharimonadales bacterium]